MACIAAMLGSSIAVAANSPGEAALAQLKESLECGTNCGSCEPKLRHMIAPSAPLMAA
ncbi:MAG: hypothetical protein ABI981_04195 [Betaproteobacteria bacterium]